MIIGLAGYAQSGKDTAALGLMKAGWQRVAFADNLKQCISTTLRISGDELELNKKDLRPLMVDVGKLGRKINPTRWIDPVDLIISSDLNKNYVITDVRYANEAEYITSRGGEIIGIVRPNYNAANEEEYNSVLEVFDKYVNFMLLNTSTAESFSEKALELSRMFGELA